MGTEASQFGHDHDHDHDHDHGHGRDHELLSWDRRS